MLFAAMAFASSLGVGVLFSALSLLVYQGAITLLAAQVQAIVSTSMMTEMTATGGLILYGTVSEQPAGNQADPNRQFPAGATHCAAAGLDSDPAPRDLKLAAGAQP